MKYAPLTMLQNNTIDKGNLQIVVQGAQRNIPIEKATISISIEGQPENVIEQIETDANGQTQVIELPAPPVELSLQPGEIQPYAQYTLKIDAKGFESVEVNGTNVLATQKAIQQVRLKPTKDNEAYQIYVVQAHTLYGDYPPKIPEAEIKPVNQSGEIVLSKVVVPEYIVVHDGSPDDPTAENYYERYRDYIKNVASSEIYATWPAETIRANVLAIMSFTLNRVYTEWYRNKGKEYTITSSTAFDHKWMSGRNYFESISVIVDELFTNYLSRPNVRQPILTQYCDGKRVQCPNAMTQWGSKYLGDEGYDAISILRSYYGQDMYINTAEEVSGVPSSWPGADLDIGSSGAKVQQIQEQINAIHQAYPALPTVVADGIFGENTQKAVKKFQSIFGLPQTGIIDYKTWYKIQEIYVGVTRIAELY